MGGLPTNSSKAKQKGCNPVSSNCVVWQGPDLPCINLCKGDTISDVIYKLAKELCDLKEMFDIEQYDLSCFASETPAPSDMKALLQALILRVCEDEGIDPTAEPSEEGCPDNCIVNIAQCFYFTSPTGDTITTMSLTDYVTAIGNRICELVSTITDLQEQINSLDERVSQLEEDNNQAEAQVVRKSDLNYVNDSELDPSGDSKFITDALRTVENGIVEQQKVVGAASKLYQAMMRGVEFTDQDSLSSSGTMKSLQGWIEQVSGLADSHNNMWVAIRDIRDAVKFIQDNTVTGCGAILYNYRTEIDSSEPANTKVIVYLDGSKGLTGFRNLDPLGSVYKITDSAGNTTSGRLDVIATANSQAGYTISLGSTKIDPTLNLTIELEAAVYNADTNTTCEKCLLSNVINQESCPSITLTATDEAIDFSIPVTEGYNYIIELFEGKGVAAIQTQSVSNPTTVITGSFAGLTAETDYEVKITTVNGAGASTECPRNPITTAATACQDPTTATATFKLP